MVQFVFTQITKLPPMLYIIKKGNLFYNGWTFGRDYEEVKWSNCNALILDKIDVLGFLVEYDSPEISIVSVDMSPVDKTSLLCKARALL